MKAAANSQAERGRKSPADRGPTAGVPRNNRSRLTNGSAVANGIDLRTAEGRRWRDLFRQYMAESGGRHEVLCKQLATLVMQRERMDTAAARGEPVDTFDLVRLAGAINRTMARLGLVSDDDEPAPDATQAVIEHVRAARAEEVTP